MRLEGTLDAFSLPDIFQLLSFTKKTGTLHLRREQQHGLVHLREGAVTGARADASRQALARRIVSAGLVDDAVLADAVEQVSADPARGLAAVLAELADLEGAALTALATEQAVDAVFDLLRWPDGEFAFVMDELDPEDVGAALSVEEIVAEGRRRQAEWDALTGDTLTLDAVVSVAPAPAGDPVLSRDEWALLAHVDGRRSVADLVARSGRGEYVVVSALAGLVGRGLLTVGEPSETGTSRREELLARLEAAPAPATSASPASAPAAPAPSARAAVIPPRPEPFVPARRPDHAEEPVPAFSRLAGTTASAVSGAEMSVGSVQGAHALQPEPVVAVQPQVAPYIDRDPSVNKSLLLRLIAGVRGL